MIEDIQSEIDSLELSPVFAYKDLQEDETAIDIKKQELKNEIEHFKEYRIALKKQLESYNIED